MKDVNQLLGYQILAKLMTHVHSLQRLNDTLEALLPPALKGHVHCAKLAHGTLTLITDNGSFSTQIRFSSQAIIAGLNEVLEQQPVKTIRCIVRPSSVKAKTTTKKPRQISASAASSIRATAQTISDEKLRLIWQKLGGKRL